MLIYVNNEFQVLKKNIINYNEIISDISFKKNDSSMKKEAIAESIDVSAILFI